jgi:VCBS repeat-containing protein
MHGFRHRRFLTLALAGTLALAAAPAVAILTINTPWVRIGHGTTPTEVYMELRSTDGAALVAVTSEIAARVAIRPPGKGKSALETLPLPAGKVLLLAPGGYRLELARVAQPLKLGDWVPLTLTIRNDDGTQQEIAIRAEVRRRSAIDDHRHAMGH